VSRRNKKVDKVTVAFLHPGEYRACFAESLKDLLFYDLSHHQRIVSHPHGQMGKQCGSAGIVDGRNKVAAAFLDETDADWLFWVDSDMGFAADTVDRLIDASNNAERPIVGGLCFAAQTNGSSSFYGIRYRTSPTIYDFVEQDDKVGFAARLVYPADEVVPVAGTGSACILIHRKVLQDIRALYQDNWYTPVTHPQGPTTFSEDLSFCVRAAACDHQAWVHTGVKTTHDKGFSFLDEEFYVAQEIFAGRRPAA
jgi:hypothetical protein